jgi:uncharacterized protein (TIGR00369 family)
MFFNIPSPFVEHCSIESLEKIPDGVRTRLKLRPELSNSLGSAHGGVIATLLDASMVAAGRFAVAPDGSQPVSTVDLSISFIAPARSLIECEARVTARQNRTLYVEAMAWNEDKQPVARAIATMRILLAGAE